MAISNKKTTNTTRILTEKIPALDDSNNPITHYITSVATLIPSATTKCFTARVYGRDSGGDILRNTVSSFLELQADTFNNLSIDKDIINALFDISGVSDVVVAISTGVEIQAQTSFPIDNGNANITRNALEAEFRRRDNQDYLLQQKLDEETTRAKETEGEAFVDVAASGNQYVFTKQDGGTETVGAHPTSLRRYNYIYLANDYDVDTDEAMAGLTEETVEVTGLNTTSDTPVGNAEEVGTIVPSTLIYTGRTDLGWSQTPPELPEDPTSTTDPKAKVDSNTVTLWIQPVDIIIVGNTVTFFRREAMKTSETDHGITLDELEDPDSEAITAIKAILGTQVNAADADAKAAADSAKAASDSADAADDDADDAEAAANRAEAAAQIVRDRTPSEQAIAAAANVYAGNKVSPYDLTFRNPMQLQDDMGNDVDTTTKTTLKSLDDTSNANSHLKSSKAFTIIPRTKTPDIELDKEFVTEYFRGITLALSNGNNRNFDFYIKFTHEWEDEDGDVMLSFFHKSNINTAVRVPVNTSVGLALTPFRSVSMVGTGTPYFTAEDRAFIEANPTTPRAPSGSINPATLADWTLYIKAELIITNTTVGGNKNSGFTLTLDKANYWFYQLRDAVTLADRATLGDIRDEVLAAERTTATLQGLASTEADLAKAFAQGSDERLAELSQTGSSAKTLRDEVAETIDNFEDTYQTDDVCFDIEGGGGDEITQSTTLALTTAATGTQTFDFSGVDNDLFETFSLRDVLVDTYLRMKKDVIIENVSVIYETGSSGEISGSASPTLNIDLYDSSFANAPANGILRNTSYVGTLGNSKRKVVVEEFVERTSAHFSNPVRNGKLVLSEGDLLLPRLNLGAAVTPNVNITIVIKAIAADSIGEGGAIEVTGDDITKNDDGSYCIPSVLRGEDVQSAEAAKEAAETARDAAEGFRDEAEDHANDANTSATASENAKDAAETAQTGSENAEVGAVAAQNAAADDATIAANKATEAATSASNAANSNNSANVNRQAAARSASEASNSAISAEDQAIRAETAKNAAQTSATEAEGFAEEAESDADRAQNILDDVRKEGVVRGSAEVCIDSLAIVQDKNVVVTAGTPIFSTQHQSPTILNYEVGEVNPSDSAVKGYGAILPISSDSLPEGVTLEDVAYDGGTVQKIKSSVDGLKVSAKITIRERDAGYFPFPTPAVTTLCLGNSEANTVKSDTYNWRSGRVFTGTNADPNVELETPALTLNENHEAILFLCGSTSSAVTADLATIISLELTITVPSADTTSFCFDVPTQSLESVLSYGAPLPALSQFDKGYQFLDNGNLFEVTESEQLSKPLRVKGGKIELGNNRGEFWGFSATRSSGIPPVGVSGHNPQVYGAHALPLMGARRPHVAIDLDGTLWPTFIDSQRGPYIERRNTRNPDNTVNTSTEVGVSAMTWVVSGEGGITETVSMTGLSDQFDLIQFAGDLKSDIFSLEAFLVPNAALVAKDDVAVTMTIGTDITESFAIQVRNAAGTTTQNLSVDVSAGSTDNVTFNLKKGDSIRVQVTTNGGSYDIALDSSTVRERFAKFTGRYTGIFDEYLDGETEILRFAVEEPDSESNTNLQEYKTLINSEADLSIDEYVGTSAGQVLRQENPALTSGVVASSLVIDEIVESLGYFFDINGRVLTARQSTALILDLKNIAMSATTNLDVVIAEVDSNGDVTSTSKVVDAESTANGDSLETEIDVEAGKSYIIYTSDAGITGIGTIEISRNKERQVFHPELETDKAWTRLLSDEDRAAEAAIQQQETQIEGIEARVSAVETEPRLVDSNNNPILIQELAIEDVLALPNADKDYVTEWANLLEAFRPAKISDKFTTVYPSSTEAADRFSDVVAATVNSTLTPTYGKGVSDTTFEANDGDSTGIKVLTPIPNLTAVIRGLKGTLDGDADTPVDFDVTVKLLVNDVQVAAQTLTINTKVGGVGNTGIAAGDVSLGALTDIEINDVVKVQITIDSAPMSQGDNPAAVDAMIDFGKLELTASGAQAILAPSEIPALRQIGELKDEVWAVRDFADSSRGLSVQVYERQLYVDSATTISDGNVFNYDDTGAIETPDVAEITIDVEAIDSSRNSKNHRIRVYKFTDTTSAPTLVAGTDLDFEAVKNAAEKKGSITFESEAGAKYFILLNNPGNRGDITGGKLTISGVFKNYPDFTNRTKYPSGYPQGFARPHNYDQVAGLYEKTASAINGGFIARFETKTIGSKRYSGFGEGHSVGNLYPDLGKIQSNIGASSVMSLHAFPDGFSTTHELIMDEQYYYDMLRDENMRKFFNAGGDIETDATAGGAMNPRNYNPAVNNHPQLTLRVHEVANRSNSVAFDVITFRHVTVNGINCRRFQSSPKSSDLLAKFNGKECEVQLVDGLNNSILTNPYGHSWTGVNVHNTTLSNLIQQFSSYKTSRDAKIREIIAVINASSLSDTIGPL